MNEPDKETLDTLILGGVGVTPDRVLSTVGDRNKVFLDPSFQVNKMHFADQSVEKSYDALDNT